MPEKTGPIDATPATAHTLAGVFATDGVTANVLHSHASSSTRFCGDDPRGVFELFYGEPADEQAGTAAKAGRVATLEAHAAGDFGKCGRSLLHLAPKYEKASRLTAAALHRESGACAQARYAHDPHQLDGKWDRTGRRPEARACREAALKRAAEMAPKVECSCGSCARQDLLTPLEREIAEGRTVVVGVDPGMENVVAMVILLLKNAPRWGEHDAFSPLITVNASQLREETTASYAYEQRAMLREQRLFPALEAAALCAFVPREGVGDPDRVRGELWRNFAITRMLLSGYASRRQRKANLAKNARMRSVLDGIAADACELARGQDKSKRILFMWGAAKFGGSASDKVLRALQRQPNVTVVMVDESYTSARCAECNSYLSKNQYLPRPFTLQNKWTGQVFRPVERARSWCVACQRTHSRDLSAAASIARRGLQRAVGEKDTLRDPSRKGEAFEAAQLKRALVELDGEARDRLPMELPVAVDGFGEDWTLEALRNAMRLHNMTKTRARRAQPPQPALAQGTGAAQPQLPLKRGQPAEVGTKTNNIINMSPLGHVGSISLVE